MQVSILRAMLDTIREEESRPMLIDTLQGAGNVRHMRAGEFIEDGYVWCITTAPARLCVGRALS